MANLFARKSIATLKADVEARSEHNLKRTLSAMNLTTLGIGAIIGAGIFVLTGSAAAHYAGPAIVLSFVLGGIACAFAGLCYAEMASMVPIAGGAYTYAYATMGECLAWIIGGQEPAERHAHRHHRLAGHLHRAIRAGRVRADGSRSV